MTKILVVDDEEMILESTMMMLTRTGYETVGAASAEEGLRILESSQIDLILSDVKLPGMDGLEFREKVPKQKFLFMSGYLTDEQMRKIGEGALIPKPFHCPDLIEKIKKALGG